MCGCQKRFSGWYWWWDECVYHYLARVNNFKPLSRTEL